VEHHRSVDRGRCWPALVAAQATSVSVGRVQRLYGLQRCFSAAPVPATPALRKARGSAPLPATNVLRPLPPQPQRTVRRSVTPLVDSFASLISPFGQLVPRCLSRLVLRLRLAPDGIHRFGCGLQSSPAPHQPSGNYDTMRCSGPEAATLPRPRSLGLGRAVQGHSIASPIREHKILPHSHSPSCG
jgi:hypothetical protein